jgi:MFS superfamily sulfate permease-like transporter
MGDLVPEGEYTPTAVLAKQGVAAVGCLAGGAGLLVLQILPPIMGIAAGALATFVGAGALVSKDADDKKGGLIVTAAGLLSVLARIPVTRRFAAPLMALAAAGLIIWGAVKGIKFIKGLRNMKR